MIGLTNSTISPQFSNKQNSIPRCITQAYHDVFKLKKHSFSWKACYLPHSSSGYCLQFSLLYFFLLLLLLAPLLCLHNPEQEQIEHRSA